MPVQITLCPNCGERALKMFYQVQDVPVYNVRLMHSREEALNIPRADIRLSVCTCCSFICNTSFDPAKLIYNEDWEESQGESETFQKFHQKLAEMLAERYDLENGSVLEIGCGKGEFLEQLARAGCAELTGFDPAFVAGRISDEMSSKINIHQRNFMATDGPLNPDMVCCKMTLEHIPQVGAFVHMLDGVLDEKQPTPVFFMVPDMQRILSQSQFWDIYYEHCSYFTETSLGYLFNLGHFRVKSLEKLYAEQYIGVHAVSEEGKAGEVGARKQQVKQVVQMARQFTANVDLQRKRWRHFFFEEQAAGRRVVLWGGSSKAVSFLSTMQAGEMIDYVVDINARKQGCFLPGSGHPVVGPEHLQTRQADTVIVMNAIYTKEVAAMCLDLEVEPALLTIEGGPV